jgi:nucleoside-triphosphatase
VLVCGDRGSGKTRWCQRLVKAARLKGLLVRGVLSPAVFHAGRKAYIDLLDLAQGERRRLASLRKPRERVAHAICLGSWAFDPVVLAWGNRVLADICDCDLLVVDEVGPLEFTLNQGMVAGLEVISGRNHRLACVTIRPAMLAEALQCWPWAEVLRLPGPVEAP